MSAVEHASVQPGIAGRVVRDRDDRPGILPGRRVAIVHDYLTEHGGAERVVEQMLGVFPQAVLHASAFDPAVMGPRFSDRRVETSFLGTLAADKARAKRMFPLFPLA